MTLDQVLQAIGSTEPSSFGEFCGALADCPEKGDKAGWREVFTLLKDAEACAMVRIERDGNGKNIESLQLTEAGADRVRGLKDQERGLLSLM